MRMVYILTTKESMPYWYDGFCDLLSTTLQEVFTAAVRCSTTDTNVFRTLNEHDTLLVTYYNDLDLKAVQTTAAKIAFYHQGSGACPYMEFIDREREKEQLSWVDLHLFSLPTFEQLVKEKYKLENTATIGFPLDLGKYVKYKSVKKKKKIVVSGHITPGKQFYLATYLLKDLMPEYEVWFSIIERAKGVSGNWSGFYHLDSFREMGYKFVWDHPTQEEFYEFISDASHIFTCSLADTIALPIVEGALCGCIPVAPKIENFWGQYNDYIINGYYPFAKFSVEDCIRSKYMSRDIITDWFDPEKVVDRLLKVI